MTTFAALVLAVLATLWAVETVVLLLSARSLARSGGTPADPAS